MKATLLLSIVAISLLGSSCNTFIGMGRDLRLAGEGMEKTANKAGEGMGASESGASDAGGGAPIY